MLDNLEAISLQTRVSLDMMLGHRSHFEHHIFVKDLVFSDREFL